MICMLAGVSGFSQMRKESDTKFAHLLRKQKDVMKDYYRGPAPEEVKMKTINYGCARLIEPGFNAIKNQSEIDFTWSSWGESNSAEYSIQRSFDSLSFETIFLTRAAGLSHGIINYHETDFTPEAGVAVYRLGITSAEGKTKYTHGVTVKYTEDDYYQGLKGAPLKDSALATQFGLNDTQVLLVLRDKQGNEFYSKFMMMVEDKQFLAVDLERKVNPGKYLIIGTSNNKVYGKKVVVK